MTQTTNGDVTYSSSFSRLLDLFSRATSLRDDPDEALQLFGDAVTESPDFAFRLIWHIRDPRTGKGERKIGRLLLRYAADTGLMQPQHLPLIVKYGRWDDIFQLFGTPLETMALEFIRAQWAAEQLNPVPSLFSKWMPAEKSQHNAEYGLIRDFLGLTPRNYRKQLTAMRTKLQLVETQMCADQWEAIDFTKVPANASFLYRKAFARHQPAKYAAFLAAAKKGEVKMNATLLNPKDLIKPLSAGDEFAKTAWENLAKPDLSDTIVLADFSGSMGTYGDNAFDISMAMTLLGLDHGWQKTVVAFATTPYIVKNESVPADKTLAVQTIRGRIRDLSTDIDAAFRLILNYCRSVETKPPRYILIISDMQFNGSNALGTPIQDRTRRSYEEAGLNFPAIVYWNVNNRVTSPVTAGDKGTILIDGYSGTLLQQVFALLQGKTVEEAPEITPIAMMLEILTQYEGLECGSL